MTAFSKSKIVNAKCKMFLTKKLGKRNGNGFTLIELLITISIIAILATVSVVVYSNLQRNARISKRIQDFQALKQALETFKTSTGKYPGPDNGGSSGGCLAMTLQPLIPSYMQTLPNDPINTANNEFCYRYARSVDGMQYRLHTKNIPVSEMSDADFRSQPQLIDPKQDNMTGGTNAGDNCRADPGVSGTVRGWAIYSLNATNCDLQSE